MKRFFTFLAFSLGFMGLATASFAVPTQVSAAPIDVFKACQNVENEVCKDQQNQKLFGPGSIWTNIVNTIIFLIGSVAVIMIIVGGLKYVTSAGDSSAVNGAKNTILYAVVGMVVSVMAYAIVNFVLTRI